MSINPAVSIVSVLIFSLMLSFSAFEAIYLLPVLFLVLLNHKKVVDIFKRILFLNFFVIFLALFVYIEIDFYKALDLFVRINLILAFNILLFFSSSGFDIVRGFMALRLNKKLVLMLFFTVRSILDLTAEFTKIKESLKARNFRPKTDLFSYKTYGNIFGMLFLSTVKRSQKLEEVLTSRGFRGELFLNYENSLRSIDIFLLSMLLVLFSIKVFL